MQCTIERSYHGHWLCTECSSIYCHRERFTRTCRRISVEAMPVYFTQSSSTWQLLSLLLKSRRDFTRSLW